MSLDRLLDSRPHLCLLLAQYFQLSFQPLPICQIISARLALITCRRLGVQFVQMRLGRADALGAVQIAAHEHCPFGGVEACSRLRNLFLQFQTKVSQFPADKIPAPGVRDGIQADPCLGGSGNSAAAKQTEA